MDCYLSSNQQDLFINQMRIMENHRSKNFKKILIIICWYGDYPWYFSYFLYSCSFNQTIDFILITDNKERIVNKPSNLQVKYLALKEIEKLASSKLGFNVSLDYPYKLCDFKATYGFLFSEIIEKYDFWGYSDIDLVFGNIRNFITEDILTKYDIISSRHDYLTGVFCLYRNTEQLTTLFMQSKDYIKVLSSRKHFSFSECNFLFKELQEGKSILEYHENIQSMTFVVKKSEAEGKLKALFNFIIIEGIPGDVTWEMGKIVYKGKLEAMLYHLIIFKSVCGNVEVLKQQPKSIHFKRNKLFLK